MAKTTTTQPQDLTTAEVAERLGIKPLSVLGLIKRGHFPNTRKLPGKTSTCLITYSDFENYLAVREARRKGKSATASDKG